MVLPVLPAARTHAGTHVPMCWKCCRFPFSYVISGMPLACVQGETILRAVQKALAVRDALDETHHQSNQRTGSGSECGDGGGGCGGAHARVSDYSEGSSGDDLRRSSALKIIAETAPRWPVFVAPPRSALGMIIFGLKVKAIKMEGVREGGHGRGRSHGAWAEEGFDFDE